MNVTGRPSITVAGDGALTLASSAGPAAEPGPFDFGAGRSSLMVAVATLFPSATPVGEPVGRSPNRTVKVSSASARTSSRVTTMIVAVVSPALTVTDDPAAGAV